MVRDTKVSTEPAHVSQTQMRVAVKPEVSGSYYNLAPCAVLPKDTTLLIGGPISPIGPNRAQLELALTHPSRIKSVQDMDMLSRHCR